MGLLGVDPLTLMVVTLERVHVSGLRHEKQCQKPLKSRALSLASHDMVRLQKRYRLAIKSWCSM